MGSDRGKKPDMSTDPRVQNLELQALEQRNQIHQTVVELKNKVSVVREKFDIKRNLQRHSLATALTITAIILVSTYFIVRSFDR
jgi:hypothetical protein